MMRKIQNPKSKIQRLFVLFLLFMFCPLLFAPGYAQEGIIPIIKFKDANINVVLQSIAEKATKDGKKVNIVTSPTVEGLVSVSLESVDWQTALKVILSAYNYGYKWIGENIILVATLEEIKERDAQEKERQEIEVPTLRVFKLKYLDANDAKKAVMPLLSPVGKVSVLESTGQAGWEFGTDVTKRERAKEGNVSRTKTLLISDVSRKLDEIENLLKQIDIMPQQILIKTRIMEVSRDYLRDIGVDWGTGTTGGSSSTLSFIDADKNRSGNAIGSVAGHVLTGQNQPSLFGAETTGLDPSDTGLRVAYRKLTGSQYEAIIHALEEDGRTNTLSAPTILTLNNQEASILVGEKYPIVKTETSTETNQVSGGSLDYYQDIGIQLNVIPQICGNDNEFVSMIVHPAITARKQDVSVSSFQSSTNTTITLASYPWLTSRETETQVIVKDGETIVIGGLLKDVKSKQKIGIPFLSKIPLLGNIFKRTTYDTDKIDLLIFITAKIVGPGETIPEGLMKVKPLVSEFKKK